MVAKYITHSRRVLTIAQRYGWLPGARYTNLRDVRGCTTLGFLDIDWRQYDFRRHLAAARSWQPRVTVAQDIACVANVGRVLDQARQLKLYVDTVIIVPKHPAVMVLIRPILGDGFMLGYSVPSRYGRSLVPTQDYETPVHLLGGRPDRQRALGDSLQVVALDCNRFTLDAAYGDYFDGKTFRPHPQGGYERCLVDSILNINALWENYAVPQKP